MMLKMLVGEAAAPPSSCLYPSCAWSHAHRIETSPMLKPTVHLPPWAVGNSRDVNEARTLEAEAQAEARTLEAEARTLWPRGRGQDLEA